MKITEEYININNSRQNIMIACKNAEYPVLLILHGGPGSPDRPLVLRYNKELFEYFTVVCWDQRGSGLSYNHECLTEKITVDLLLSDLKCLVQHLLSRFGKQKIYLAGHSWGAYLGLRFVSEYPQYIEYYIGTGQGISSEKDEIYKYNFVLREAEKSNDQQALKKLLLFGEPQGYHYKNKDMQAKRFVAKMVQKYGGYINPESTLSMNQYFSLYLKHYGVNVFKVIKGINYSVKYLNPQVNSGDLITCITDLNIPALFISGECDYVCPVEATQNWFEKLTAPKKDFVLIKNASHMVNFEKPDEWCKQIIGLL